MNRIGTFGRSAVFVVVVILAFVNSGCGGAATSASTASGTPTTGLSSPPSGTTVSLAVIPTSVTTGVNGTVQFTATVTGSSNTAVTWSISNGGGTVSSTGLYTAPSVSGTATVVATSTADPSKTGSAGVTITSVPSVSITVTPASTSVLTGKTAQFVASVNGTTNTAVNWSATAGTISAAGLYTAPTTVGTYTVKATSAADPTKTASATVTVGAVIVSVSPNTASVATGGTVQFTASVAGTTNSGVNWSVASGGGTVSASGLYTAPSTAGSASVMATSTASPNSSGLANVTVNTPATMLVSASPSSISFGSVSVGSASSTAIKLTNSGNSAVTVSSASLTGAGFSLAGLSFPLALAAGASQNATLTFAPLSSGSASGSVSFVSNATNSPTTVSVSGSGVTSVQHTATLNWQASGSSPAGYNVYRSTTSGGPYTRLNSSLETVPSYADSTVSSGMSYYYVVTEVSSSGMESGYSGQVRAVIPTP